MEKEEQAARRPHLVHSHAHEGEIPGTVDLSAAEGDDTAYGQALYPVPAEDPNDPLQWPTWKKNVILVIVAVYSFLGNSSLTGPSVYIGLYSKEFGISAAEASGLISYPNLAFGFGSLILVPLYLKIGRRPVALLSMLMFLAGLIGASRSTSYTGLMIARVFHGFGSGVCESLPVQLVNDIFFLHERGKKIGYYTICLCLGSTGPLYAGYMLAAGYSWRLFFYVEAAFAGTLFIMAFLFVEESTYCRRERLPVSDSSADSGEKSQNHIQLENVTSPPLPLRKSFWVTLKPWSAIDPEPEFFMTMLRSFTYFLVPAVFWVITSYGLYIGLGALAFNYTFPLKITEPPYNWSETNSGLIAVASFIGYLIALPFSSTSDRLAAYRTKRNNGIRESEMRLPALFPALLLAPAGLVVYGLTAQRNLHWTGFFAGVAMNQFASYFYFTFTLAYAVDSYYANTSEMLIAMNLGKQAISFGMGSYLLDWILTRGYATVISGIFGGVVLANNLMVIVFLLFGKRIRRWTARSWLGKLHQRTATIDMTH
ncbi:MFS transporter [Penicillium canariense]|uniref:MFS transporter n=1 Tax=Penicillium canariense TaxID=189055 RepID=A0A9W9LFY1_9EURO|nr:MFS transporter [Penicillium canariense]KAJ5153068.1 MFS transporter [Penicillium canariense]